MGGLITGMGDPASGCVTGFVSASAINCRHESRGIRAWEGLAEARLRGVVWGKYGRHLAEQNRQQTDQFAEEAPSLDPGGHARRPPRPRQAGQRAQPPGCSRQKGRRHPAPVDRLLRRLPGFKEELATAGEAQQQEFLATQQELWATQKAGDPGLI